MIRRCPVWFQWALCILSPDDREGLVGMETLQWVLPTDQRRLGWGVGGKRCSDQNILISNTGIGGWPKAAHHETYLCCISPAVTMDTFSKRNVVGTTMSCTHRDAFFKQKCSRNKNNWLPHIYLITPKKRSGMCFHAAKPNPWRRASIAEADQLVNGYQRREWVIFQGSPVRVWNGMNPPTWQYV